jgi:hypothetical protein
VPLREHVSGVMAAAVSGLNQAFDAVESSAAAIAARAMAAACEGLTPDQIEARRADLLAGVIDGANAARRATREHVAARLADDAAKAEKDGPDAVAAFSKRLAKAQENRVGKVKRCLAGAIVGQFGLALEWDPKADGYSLQPLQAKGDKVLTAKAKANASADVDRQDMAQGRTPERDAIALESLTPAELANALLQAVGVDRAKALIDSAYRMAQAAQDNAGAARAAGDGQPG